MVIKNGSKSYGRLIWDAREKSGFLPTPAQLNGLFQCEIIALTPKSFMNDTMFSGSIEAIKFFIKMALKIDNEDRWRHISVSRTCIQGRNA